MTETTTEFEQFAQDVDPDIVERIRSRFGGTPLYIPRNMSPEHPIAVVIGFDRAKRLVESHGGSWLDYVPLRTKVERDQLIREKRAEGCTHEDIAVEFGISKRLALQLCEGVRPRRIQDVERRKENHRRPERTKSDRR